MTDTAHATPGPLPPPPPHRSHGCLWGCGLAAVIVVVAIIGGISYMGWYFYTGFKNNPALQMVVHTMNDDGVARTVLGNNITITSISSANVSSDTTKGSTQSYVANLKGSRGTGVLTVMLETHGNTTSITSMVLTGPDGHKYNLRGSGGSVDGGGSGSSGGDIDGGGTGSGPTNNGDNPPANGGDNSGSTDSQRQHGH